MNDEKKDKQEEKDQHGKNSDSITEDLNNKTQNKEGEDILNKGEDNRESKEYKIKENEEISQCENSDKSMNKKKMLYLFCVIFIAIIICISLLVSKTVKKYEKLVYPGTMLYGKDISKYTEKEVLNEIINIEKKLESQNISIKAKDKDYNLKVNEIINENNKEELLNEIMDKGKDASILKKYINIINKKEFDYNLDMEIDKEKIEEMVDEIELDTKISPKEPSVAIDGEKIEYVDGIDGSVLDDDALVKKINESVLGTDNKNISIVADYKLLLPNIDINELKKVDTRISQFSTHYGGGSGRGTNIEIAAKKLDNMVLMPGEEFSYEKAIGPVSASNGYKEATVIINGKIDKGIGGGVCQVSSTLYNTQLKAGILPTQRRNHSKAVDYVPRGLDATLASGSIDYRFVNTYKYPLVLNTYTSKGNLYIEIWSNKDATNGITYEPVSYVSGKKADAYLYGYDKDGNKVYEKYIDSSTYK